MSAPAEPFVIHPGLRTRFLTAGERIAWNPTSPSPLRPADRRGRIAHLGEEVARVEEWGSETDGGLMVDSGPLGALVLIIVIDGRGTPRALGALHADRDPAFPSGALVAVWGHGLAPEDEHPRLRDLVELARYALE